MQAELHHAKNVLQKDTLCEERAETNLDCYTIEVEAKFKEAEERERERRICERTLRG